MAIVLHLAGGITLCSNGNSCLALHLLMSLH